MTCHASYASIHRKAVREIERIELARAIAEIESSTHVSTWLGKVYSYGTLAECEKFVDGLGNRAAVRKITADDKEVQIAHKCRAYRVSR